MRCIIKRSQGCGKMVWWKEAGFQSPCLQGLPEWPPLSKTTSQVCCSAASKGHLPALKFSAKGALCLCSTRRWTRHPPIGMLRSLIYFNLNSAK